MAHDVTTHLAPRMPVHEVTTGDDQPNSSDHPGHPKPLPLSLLHPRATRHIWPRPPGLKNCRASRLHALEHATVCSGTVVAPFQPPPSTSGLPSAPDEMPRRLGHDSWSAPSSFSLLWPPSHARRPPASSNARPHMRELSGAFPAPSLPSSRGGTDPRTVWTHSRVPSRPLASPVTSPAHESTVDRGSAI